MCVCVADQLSWASLRRAEVVLGPRAQAKYFNFSAEPKVYNFSGAVSMRQFQ